MSTMFDGAFCGDLDPRVIAPFGGVCWNHYLTGDHAVTSMQPDKARAAGFGSVLTYERGPGELVGLSRAGGQGVGRRILDAVQGLPTVPPLDRTVAAYPSADVSIAPAAAGSTDAALLGIRDVIGDVLLIGEYGDGVLLQHVWNEHLVDVPGWLSGSTGFPGWADAAAADYVCMVQRVGQIVPGTDVNDITNIAALRAWWPDGSPYNLIGDDMSAADVQAIEAYNLALVQGQTKTLVLEIRNARRAVAVAATANVDAIAAAVLAKMPVTGATVDEIKAAFADVLDGSTIQVGGS